MEFVFVDLPENYDAVYLCQRQDGADGKPVPVRQVLWGDFLWLDENIPFDAQAEWTMVVWARSNPAKRRDLKVLTRHIRAFRPLEIVFVDVGQGDGAVLITPERNEKERIVVIDAGLGDEMGTFLDERFGAYRDGFRFHAAVMTHPDKDHYLGFGKIFANRKVHFDTVYHSGLVERPEASEWDKLGKKTREPGRQQWWLENLCEDHQTFRNLFGAPVAVGRRQYAQTVRGALDNGTVGEFRMLAKDGPIDQPTWMPGFGPDDALGYTIEVLGPIVERAANGARRLRCFPDNPRTKSGAPSFSADAGKTKNGHSVLLRLTFGSFNVLFGGDLNRPAEEFLLTRYGGLDEWPLADPVAREEMIARASSRFRSEVMKTCHHGSSDVTDEFLEAVNPAAFVISSGDEEDYVHPRPDLLGRLGKKGRGLAPVLLSTELQRSWREREKVDAIEDLQARIDQLHSAPTPALRDALKKDIAALGGSNVSVDGAIYVKTDGDRLITAFKKESQTETDRWFYYEYRIVNGQLILQPRDEH